MEIEKMSLEARRKKNATATSKPEASQKKAKKTGPQGPMRSIALGRAYTEYTAPVDDNNMPVARSLFDGQNRAAIALPKDTDKERVVNSSTFIRHLNATVFKQIFGVSLRNKIARMIVEGIADQCLILTEKGYKVKIPNLVTLQKVQRKARKARNPRTKEEVQVPARPTLAAKASRAAKIYLAQAGQ
jgi:DNA-binding protein HU-beta